MYFFEGSFKLLDAGYNKGSKNGSQSKEEAMAGHQV